MRYSTVYDDDYEDEEERLQGMQSQQQNPSYTYQESDAVKKARQLLEQQQAAKPGAYTSPWASRMDESLNKILNRDKFSYDVNADSLYQQYKQNYITQGKMAMADTVAQAAALTGGYGNSYATTAGYQAYQGSLQKLNDIIPELYQMAYQRYRDEGTDLQNQYAMMADRENMDYARYRDALSDYNAERDYLTGRYDTESNTDYARFSDARNFSYQQERDTVADSQWASEFAFQQERAAAADAQWQAEFETSIQQYNDKLAYQRERDAVSDAQWQQQFDRATEQYLQNLAYQQSRDAVSDQQYADKLAYQKERDAVSDAQWQKEYDLSAYKAALSASSSSSKSSADPNNPKAGTGLSTAQENKLQDYINKADYDNAERYIKTLMNTVDNDVLYAYMDWIEQRRADWEKKKGKTTDTAKSNSTVVNTAVATPFGDRDFRYLQDVSKYLI